MSEEELTKAMEGLGMDEGDGEGNIFPIMQSIMQNLLSKDVLYPSLKEITEKVCEFPLLPLLFSLHQLVGYFAQTVHNKSIIRVSTFFQTYLIWR